LGISLLARFRRRRADADLERAIALFEETEHISTSRIERASVECDRFGGPGIRPRARG
jgi:hypothetical protein